MATIQKLQKVTSRGQITLPVSWRKETGANTITLAIKGERIQITPARLQQKESEYTTVFDAIRDNKGKGLKAADLVKILKKIDR